MGIGMGMGFGPNLVFSLFPILFLLVFSLVIGMIVVTMVKGMKQWHSNNQSPVLTVEARVVAKRADIRRHRHNDDMMSHTRTTYYVTFQVESGDRMELQVGDGEYGLLAEGDQGKLTFQGSRYQGFQRGR